jgi:hypothetical protein
MLKGLPLCLDLLERILWHGKELLRAACDLSRHAQLSKEARGSFAVALLFIDSGIRFRYCLVVARERIKRFVRQTFAQQVEIKNADQAVAVRALTPQSTTPPSTA